MTDAGETGGARVVRMLGQETLPSDDEIDRVSAVLVQHLQHLDPRSAPQLANALIFARDTASIVYFEKSDHAALAEIAGLARRFHESVAALSPGARFVFDDKLLMLWDGREPLDDPYSPDEGAVGAVSALLRNLAFVADHAASQGVDRGQVKWQNVVIVDEARELWWRAYGRAPRSSNGVAPPPFERFLADLFQALRILTVEPSTAIKAWRRWVDRNPAKMR